MNISDKRLVKCWWCGENPYLSWEDRHDDFYYRNKDSSRYLCTPKCKCGTTGHLQESMQDNDVRFKAVKIWNSGEVYIPLEIELPKNHFILSMETLPSKHSFVNPKKFKIKITRDRGIAEKIYNDLLICIPVGQKPRPHMFTLINRENVYVSTKLLNADKFADYMIFEFSCSDLKLNVENAYFKKSINFTTWKKTFAERPPVFDRIFDILSQD